MPRILTFTRGFATSVSSNSPQISSLTAVMDGNIQSKTAKTDFQMKTLHKDRGSAHSLVPKHMEQTKNIFKST